MKNYLEGCDCMTCREARKFEEFKLKEKQMINSEMTKAQAIELLDKELWDYGGSTLAKKWVEIWERLGVIKFKPEPEIYTIFSKDQVVTTRDAYGTIGIEEWPEGLVLWVGGRIVYKSWKQ